MLSHVYRVGSRWTELHTDNLELVDIVSQALPSQGLDPISKPDARILVVQESDAAITLQYANKPSNCAEFRLADSIDYFYAHHERRYYVRAENLFSGVIDVDNCLAEYVIQQPLAPRQALHLLILDPLSLLLPRHGVYIYHGAAIVRNGQALLLFGQSGLGKSTLAFLLSHAVGLEDTKIMADDTLIVDYSSTTIEVYPVLSGFGLAEWTINQYHMDVSASNILYYGEGKTYLRTVGQQSSGPVAVGGLYFLVREPKLEIDLDIIRLTKGNAIRHILDMQTTIAGPYLKERLDVTKRLSDQTEAFILSFSTYCNPWSLSRFLEAKGA